MAARVVWLVATGQALPEQVLGLTFTRKAAQQLGSRPDLDCALPWLGRRLKGEDLPTLARFCQGSGHATGLFQRVSE